MRPLSRTTLVLGTSPVTDSVQGPGGVAITSTVPPRSGIQDASSRVGGGAGRIQAWSKPVSWSCASRTDRRLWRSSQSRSRRALSTVVDDESSLDASSAGSPSGLRATVKLKSRLGRTVIWRAGADSRSRPRARSVYDPAGSDGRKNRPLLSDRVTSPLPPVPRPNNEMIAPATGAPRGSSTQPTTPPPFCAAHADGASSENAIRTALRDRGRTVKSRPPGECSRFDAIRGAPGLSTICIDVATPASDGRGRVCYKRDHP
jgi:hypothetical protein